MQAPHEQRTTPRLVLAAAERFADRPAIEDGELRLSYAGLGEAVLRVARAFAGAGLRPADRFAIWAPNLGEWILAALGGQAAGGVLVPLNTRYKGAEGGHILRASGARLLFTVRDFLETHFDELLADQDLPALEDIVLLRGSAPDRSSWQAFLARGDGVSEASARARAEAVSPDDLSDVMFTSGTTGTPKGVMTAHGQNLRAFETWSEVVGLREGDRCLAVNPFSHPFGYKAGWLSAFLRGATVLPQPVFDVPQVLERVGTERVSVFPGPPAIYQTLLAHPDRQQYDLSNLRLAVTGGAPIAVELVHRMRDELGFESVVTGYGLTECCGIVSMCRHDDDPETIATTSGRPIPGVEVRLVDAEGVDVAPGEPGEVVVRGYNVMRGYLDDPVATAETIDPDGWLHTGDVAVMDAAGSLRITDRIKDMFIMGGFNCYPAEIENLMFAHPEIAQVAVVGVPDARMGEVGMAFVVPVAGASLAPESLTAWCREQMANYKVPRRFEIVDALPMNASGKVVKGELRERAAR